MSNQMVARLGLVLVLGAAACAGNSGAGAGGSRANIAPVAAPSAHAADAGGAPRGGETNADAGVGGAPSLESKDSRAVAKMLVKVSELRGLTASRPVPGIKLERDALVAAVKDKALREYPPEALRHEGQILQLLGFAPPNFDYVGAMMKLLEAQLQGFYEPKNGTMYLAADLYGQDAQATLAHELVHALQDQKWDLRSRSLYRPGHGDEAMATACIAEGDATSLMLDYLLKPEKTALDIPDEVLRELMKSGVSIGDIESVPHILRTSLLAPYIEGIGFVHALRRKGGWAAVDRAWDKIPTTTEQILHVDKWEAGEGPIAVGVPTAQSLGTGWSKVDEDEFGELTFALTLEEWMSPADARVTASGWGGDRSSTWTRGDEIAFAVHVRYDAAKSHTGKPHENVFAERAMGKISSALKKTFGKPSTSDANHVCFDRKNTGPLLFVRKARDLVMLAGPAKEGPTSWSATGTCADAKVWAAEILK
ncbi:MAG: hypothetical protein FWD69_15455 [Polyangiaceae bacterium]|nr:hypothetical protein [Polyangiaceae bacterium]